MTISLILVEEPKTIWKGSSRAKSDLNVPPDRKSMDNILTLEREFAGWEPEKIYSYSVDPALSCAKLLGNKMGIRHIESPSLKPLDMGAWTGLDWLEVRDRFARSYRKWKAEPYVHTPPQGESMVDVEKRVEHLMEEIRGNAQGVLIIASQEVLAAFCNNVLPKFGASISYGVEHENDNTSLWQLFDSKSGWMVWDLLVDDEG